MIENIGIDIVEKARIQSAIQRWDDRFLCRIFRPTEILLCRHKVDTVGAFGARFAAKEALLKALGIGLSQGIRWHDIEVLSDDQGKPFFKF